MVLGVNVDRLKAGLVNFVRGVFPRLDYYALYSGKVISQGGSNSFDFQPDNQKVPGVSGVPVRMGLPGVTVQLALGSSPRCLLGFLEGDPSQPFLALWEQPGLDTLTVDPAATVNLGPAAAAVGRVGDAVSATATVVTWMAAVSTALSLTAPPDFGTISAGSPKVKA